MTLREEESEKEQPANTCPKDHLDTFRRNNELRLRLLEESVMEAAA